MSADLLSAEVLQQTQVTKQKSKRGGEILGQSFLLMD